MMLCSAFLDESLRQEALDAGFRECIQKHEIPQLPELLRALARDAA
jgi:hypothetical protein